MIKKKVNGSIMNFANMNEEQSGDNSITAFVEVSPAEAAHNVDDYIVYNHIIYQVIDDISIGDTLVVNTNIEQAVLPEGTVIYSDDEQGSTSSLSYNDLGDKPQINNVELASGNNSLSALGIQGKLTFDNVPTDGSNNPVKSDGIYDSEKDIYAVMGEMGAKNLIPYPYYEDTEEDRGITWTNNADGTITITGTATADSAHNLSQRTNTGKLYLPNGKYKLSGCPSGGSDNTYYLEAVCTKNSGASRLGIDNGTGVDITVNGDDYGADGAYVMVRGIVKNGYAVTNPIVFKPMLRLASDTDDTYQQYAKTNKQLTDEIANKVDKVAGKGLSTNDYSDTEKGKVSANASAIEAIADVYGAKNLLPNNVTSQTISGVTFTVNSDGSVTANGTPTQSFPEIEIAGIFLLKAGSYILSSGQNANSVGYVSLFNESHSSIIADTYGKQNGEAPFVLTADTYVRASAVIYMSEVASNVTVYPMIRDARITDPTYVPYAMTNKQLTERVMIVDVLIDSALTAGETANLNITSVVPSGYMPVSVSYIGDDNYDLCYSMFTQFRNGNWFLLFQNTTNSSVTLKGHAKISMLKYSII